MNELHATIGPLTYCVDLSRAIDLSIPIQFDDAQLQAFGAPKSNAHALHTDSFVGDVHQGGSCNCATLHFTPHCNGTHTESVAHLTREPHAVTRLARGLYLAQLISVQPIDNLITAAALKVQFTDTRHISALIVRTLPNTPDKRTRDYDHGAMPAYFEPAALAWLNHIGIDHLLVDLPSVDRMADGGLLLAHRAFWGLPPGSQLLQQATRPHATITELIYVPDEVGDGRYLLNLNVAPFASDAAPSRPLLYPLQQQE